MNQSQFGGPPLTDVVKNLIIINVILFILTLINPGLYKYLGMYSWHLAAFEPYQIVTHMFMHGSFTHLLFNMFGVWMFGSILEMTWGPKRFLLYYLITGIGAAILHGLITYFMGEVSISVGASGALFGLLLAFGMLFPNQELMLLFFPFPIKAKYFVLLYGAFELFMGINNSPGDNIAHFAHLGGMLFGYIILFSWGYRGFGR